MCRSPAVPLARGDGYGFVDVGERPENVDDLDESNASRRASTSVSSATRHALALETFAVRLARRGALVLGAHARERSGVGDHSPAGRTASGRAPGSV